MALKIAAYPTMNIPQSFSIIDQAKLKYKTTKTKPEAFSPTLEESEAVPNVYDL